MGASGPAERIEETKLIQLTQLNIYPLKSGRGVPLEEAAVERRGLRGDRRWMLVDDDGVFISQREVPRLALIEAKPTVDGLDVRAPGVEPIHIAGPTDSLAEVRVWDDVIQASDAGYAAAEWFARYIGRPARLVYMGEEIERRVDNRYAVKDDDHVSFADGYPVLLASENSLAALNERGPRPIPMNRFRPNLVVTGAAPFEEDTWREIRIGVVRFHVVKGCARCVVTTIDQETAQQGKEPLRTLNQFRKRDGKVYFGQNLIPVREGVLHCGDRVEVISRHTDLHRHNA